MVLNDVSFNHYSWVLAFKGDPFAISLVPGVYEPKGLVLKQELNENSFNLQL